MQNFVLGAVLTVLLTPFLVSAQTSVDVEDQIELVSRNPNPIARLSARLAYNSDLGAVGGVGFVTDRLFGRDQTLAFNIETQESGASVSLRYENDKIFGESPAFGLSVTRSETRAGKIYDFNAAVTRFEPRLTWVLTPYLRSSAFAYYSWNEIEDVSAANSALIVADVGDATTSGLGFNLEYRFPVERENVLRNARLRLGAEVGLSSTDHEFLRLTSSGHTVHLFNDGNVVLRSQLRLGAIKSQSGVSSIGDRYMLGQASIRGFAFGGFGPRDLEVADMSALGGNYYGIAKFDMRFPNALEEHAERLTPGVFVDMGSLWGLDDTAGGVAGADTVDDGSHLRASIGLSLRINTGIGAIQVYVAQPFASENYDRTNDFGLELSQTF